MQFTLSFHGIEDAGKTALLNRLVNLKSCEDKVSLDMFYSVILSRTVLNLLEHP